MKHHNLKTWPEYYKQVQSGEKKFEIRINDRDFQPGDILHLDEWDPKSMVYTGKGTTKQVGYVLYKHDGLKEGFVIMSLLTV